MLLKVLTVVACLLLTACFGEICQHYSKVNLQAKSDDPCNKTDLDEAGICNITRKCPSNGFTVHCFALWNVVLGKNKIVKQGCQSENMDMCSNSSSCIGRKRKPKHPFHCCCTGDLCNTQFTTYEPLNNTETSHDDEDDDDGEIVPEERDEVAFVLLTTLLPITIVSSAIALGYFCYRKRKQAFDQMRHRQIESPGMTMPAQSVPGTLLSPSLSELNFPQLIELIARGRFGCVWKAQLHDRYVAVKICDMQDKQSWQNEQDIFNTELIADHPNILRFIGATVRGAGMESELWLITEFHESGSLADYLKVHTLSLLDTLRIIQTMASGLAFLHDDVACRSAQTGFKPAIAHRDFKSKNVLITDQKTAVIADFGLAVKFLPGENMGDNRSQAGTGRYMAPEILEGAINFQRDAFLRIDIYAFALVFWEVVTRCYEAPGGAETVYLMPFELELGPRPSLEEMQDCVIEKKMRPNLRREWRQHEVFGILCDTMEECWDHDAEARLSAGCVEERIQNVLLRMFSPPSDLPIHSNCVSPDVITNTTPLNPPHPPPTNAEMQNEINNQRNEVLSSQAAREDDSFLADSNSLLDCQTGRSTPVLLPPSDRESNV